MSASLVVGGQWGSSTLREGFECYVADATNGEPECLPSEDPSVSLRVGDNLSFGCGFAVEFVIAPAESQPVPAACEDLLECCASVSDSLEAGCLDQVDNSALTAVLC